MKTELTTLRAGQRPKAPWWAIVGAVDGIMASLGVLISIGLNLLEVLHMLQDAEIGRP